MTFQTVDDILAYYGGDREGKEDEQEDSISDVGEDRQGKRKRQGTKSLLEESR